MKKFASVFNWFQVYVVLIGIVCVPGIALALEPIATIGQPLPIQHSFLDNNTILRVVPTHIQVVDANTGDVMDEFGNLAYCSDVVFSPNAPYLAIQSSNRPNFVEIWDVNTREKISEWEIDDEFHIAAFSPTQPLLAILIDRRIHLWNWQTGQHIDTTIVNLYGNAFAFAPDGKHLVVASKEPYIEVWNVETGERVEHFRGHTSIWLRGTVISPDGNHIAMYNSRETDIYVWNIETQTLIWNTKSGTGAIKDLTFSPDSQSLYVATRTQRLSRSGPNPWEGWDDKVRVWDVKSGQQIDAFSTKFHDLNGIALSPDGKTVLMEYPNVVVLWDIEEKKPIQIWEDFVGESYPSSVELSPDGKTVAAISRQFIKTWDVASEQMQLSISADGYRFEDMAISPDSKRLAVIKDPWVEMRDIQTGKVETQIYPHTVMSMEDITFSSTGRWLTVSGWEDLVIFDLNNLENPQILPPDVVPGLKPYYDELTFSENDEFLAASVWSNSTHDRSYWIYLWKREGETFVFQYAWETIELDYPLAFHTNAKGSIVIAAPDWKEIQIWELLPEKRQMLASLVNKGGPVRFSKDGRYLYSPAQIWDWQTSRPIKNTSYPRFDDINQDGSVILSYTMSGQYQVYDVKHTLSLLPYAVEPEDKKIVILGEIKRNQLLQNFPNPFNPETWIPFQLADKSNVTIQIYTPTGDLVRTLSLGVMAAGNYSSQAKAIHWDGRNNRGEPVSSGIYLYTINAGEFSATRKMLIRK
ncbi:T9SS type A sorting domain-containing protein [Candidatus Poribacteria bacterium]|nr:T9SS type A sorting domain-containing protein [Candidatus Poribacteria bacterium]